MNIDAHLYLECSHNTVHLECDVITAVGLLAVFLEEHDGLTFRVRLSVGPVVFVETSETYRDGYAVNRAEEFTRALDVLMANPSNDVN